MALENARLLAFNRGLISTSALARIDVTSKVPWAAEVQRNMVPRVLGSMMLRPGFQYLSPLRDNLYGVHIPFVFTNTDTAILEFTDGVMRVRVNDEVVQREAVTDNIANGSFATNLTGWNNDDDSGAASSWTNGTTYGLPSGGYLALVGTGFNQASRNQVVNVAGSDIGKTFGLRINVSRGPVELVIEDTATNNPYVTATLLTGTHSVAFAPTGQFTIRLSSRLQYATLVDSVSLDTSGDLEIGTPWTEDDLDYMRWVQSNDVVFVARRGLQQRRIERRGPTSWSVVLYEADDGPFLTQNFGPTAISPSALSGDVTLTADTNIFNEDMVGGLFRITSIGQVVRAVLNGAEQQTGEILVTGVGTSRNFNITITGTFSATITLQRSVSEPGAWFDVATYTTPVNFTYGDGLDNQIIYYRLAIKTGNYVSGSATASMTYSSGSITGIARVSSFTDAKNLGAYVLTPFGNTTGSSDWSEGAWSDYRGWPMAGMIYEGRLWWAGNGYADGSVSDAYNSFDDTVEGESAPIRKPLGSGAVQNVNWMLALQRLVTGSDEAEITVRSSAFGELITAANANLKAISTKGSAALPAIQVDDSGIFVQAAGTDLMVADYVGEKDGYLSDELNKWCPELTESGVRRLSSQTRPDTRIHATLGNGLSALMVRDQLEEVSCFIDVETDGVIEDTFQLPEFGENAQYYSVKRTINGQTVRYLEKWAKESECQGGTLNKMADSFIVYQGVSTTTISGLDHLEGEDVVVWQDGRCPFDDNGDIKTFTVSGGAITLDDAAENAVVGLPYSGKFKSTKLAYAAPQFGTALAQKKRVLGLALLLKNTHCKAIKYGQDDYHLDPMPEDDWDETDGENTIFAEYDKEAFTFNGTFETDPRLVITASAPLPATVVAAIIGIITNEKVG